SICSRDYNEIDGRTVIRPHTYQLNKIATLVQQESDNGEPVDLDQYLPVVRQASDNGISGGVAQSGFSLSPIIPINPIADGITEDEVKVLLELKVTLLLPLFSKDEMLGVISLGPRMGDLPFSRDDKQLLMNVSGPTALAIENARLVEHM